MRVPRTFTLDERLSAKLNKIPSGQRSQFVQEALERALEIRATPNRPATKASSAPAAPRKR